MERTTKEKNFLKIINRSLSYVILFLSVVALCYCISNITKYISLNKENNDLQETLIALKEKNDSLEIINEKLKDSDYFSVYVKDHYQYSSNTDSIIPIK
jgi:cell division protein FtsB